MSNDAAPLAQEVIEDFDAAFDRTVAAETIRMKRRALREVLGHLYTLREHCSGVGRESYYAAADESPDGRTVEGLVIVRNALIHQLTRSVAPEVRDTYSDTYSDQYGTFTWLKRTEISAPPKLKRDLWELYDRELAGREVVGTLRGCTAILGGDEATRSDCIQAVQYLIRATRYERVQHVMDGEDGRRYALTPVALWWAGDGR